MGKFKKTQIKRMEEKIAKMRENNDHFEKIEAELDYLRELNHQLSLEGQLHGRFG